jgi:hypothetical protein
MIGPVHHPGFWFLVLLGVLGYSIYRAYEAESDIQRLCELIGPRAAQYRSVQTTTRTVETICADHQQDIFL